MTRRKGEKPIVVKLDDYTPLHPVAHMIATGDYWFDAWQRQKGMPLARLSKITGIPSARLLAISDRDRVSWVEIEAFARAWSISTSDLLASIGDRTEVVQ